MLLRGSVALVTGGSQGIGFACAKRLAALGARVAITSRDAQKASTSAQQLGEDINSSSDHAQDWHLGLQCDVRSEDDVKAVFKSLRQITNKESPLNIVVNAVGVNHDGLLLRTSDDHLQVRCRLSANDNAVAVHLHDVSHTVCAGNA